MPVTAFFTANGEVLFFCEERDKKQPQNVVFNEDGAVLLIYKRACKRSLQILQNK